MGVVSRRPAGVILCERRVSSLGLRVHTWNPGAAFGWLMAWLFSFGRQGRLPFYLERTGGLIPSMTVGERGPEYVVRGANVDRVRRRPPQGGTGMSGYEGPANPKPPTAAQVPRPLPKKPPPPPAPPPRGPC